MSGSAPKKSDSMRYYDILGVPKLAWDDELKRGYTEAVIKNDPEKGGDPEKLMEVVQAYKILSDHKKRRIYDAHGEDGLKETLGGDSGGKEADTAVRSRRQKRGRDVKRSLMVSLEELYSGIRKKVEHVRRVICRTCAGKGSKPGSLIECSGCKGIGTEETTMAQFGPSETSHTLKQPCGECNGTGVEIVPWYRCEKCRGSKFERKVKTMWIDVEKGAYHLQKITIPGEADEEPDTITGDLLIEIMQNDHPKFLRNREDLFYEHTLSLAESLCGYRFLLTHLDGRKLQIKSASPHETVQPDSYWEIKDEGMPAYQHPSKRGSLFIHFKVEFPVNLSDTQREILVSALPPMKISEWTAAEIRDATSPMLLIDDEETRRREAAARTGNFL